MITQNNIKLRALDVGQMITSQVSDPPHKPLVGTRISHVFNKEFRINNQFRLNKNSWISKGDRGDEGDEGDEVRELLELSSEMII